MEGTPLRTSAAKRTAEPMRLPLYSERNTPLTIPTGTAGAAARPSRISVPTIALAIPPPGSPTGFGIWVKKAGRRAGSPWRTTKNRMSPSGTSARTTEAAQKTSTAREVARRRRSSPVIFMPSCRRGDGGRGRRRHGHRRVREPPQEEPGQRVDDDGDEEEHQPDLDQGVEVEIAGGFRELVGDHGGHRVLRSEERQRDLRVVPDDHGHRHGLPQRPPQPEHHRPD